MGDPAPGERLDEAPPPGTTPDTAISVSSLNAAAREILESAIRPLWVVGEVANWRRVASGHCYFSLRDDTAQLSCVMFRLDAARLPTEPEEGMEVCAFGQVSLYEARGAYQLIVRALEAKGEGLWRLAFERLRSRLAAEGLLDPARKRPLPRVPARIGVVTSRTGAAVRDVLTVIRRRAPWTRVLLSDCRVQGEDAAADIVAALDRLVREGSVDVIILTRGGGSVEDLWPFNEEVVARAIAASPIPTVSAVGHEIDITISDLVADVRAPTPSAAAEMVVPDGEKIQAELRGLAEGLVAGLRGRARRGEERALRAMSRLVETARLRMERLEGRLALAAGRLEVLSPLRTLSRGYAVPLGSGGKVLRTRDRFTSGMEFDLRVVDGRVRSRVLGVEPVEKGEERGD
ncbi:MAG: exodeoxyribonuclease VII large subunit [Gemmatimonadota bacterium]